MTQLFKEGKCYICKQEGHKFYDCPNRKKTDASASAGIDVGKGDMRDDAARKTRPSAGVVPYIIGDAKDEKRIELCRAWDKARDEHCLFFFDNGAKVNFISPELAAKLGKHGSASRAFEEATATLTIFTLTGGTDVVRRSTLLKSQALRESSVC